MSMITVERATAELNEAGTLTASDAYSVMTAFTFEWNGFTIKSQGFINDLTRTELPGINIFSAKRNLHPILRLYQDYVALRRMIDAGYTVKLDEQSMSGFRVRVQRKEGRKLTYNVHTTSTSGYPILVALEKWVQHLEDLEAEAEDVDAPPTRFEVLFYMSDWDGHFYHGQTRRAAQPAREGMPAQSPIVGVLEGMTGLGGKPYLMVTVDAPTEATAEGIALETARDHVPEGIEVHMRAVVS